MHYSNFRYLDFWFWFALYCATPESDAAASRFTQASNHAQEWSFPQRVVISWRCAGRVEP